MSLPPAPDFCRARALPLVDVGMDARAVAAVHRAAAAEANKRAGACGRWYEQQVRQPMARATGRDG